MKETSSPGPASRETQVEPSGAECVWCGSGLQAEEQPCGLTTRFHKPIAVRPGEVKKIPISIAHARRTVAGYVQRHPAPAEKALLLTFPTCSQSCAETLFQTLERERRVFTVPLAG
ncbi:MAG TPA: hypothetical protein VLU25_11085 [Acidobacteriota bacterium]|nr:hypothetical protein [Acidobacteriota bacterium]